MVTVRRESDRLTYGETPAGSASAGRNSQQHRRQLLFVKEDYMSGWKGARWLASAMVAGAAWFGAITTAEAIPVFARQTGHNCQACHISYPELTAYGREFKLNGYTFGVAQPVPFAVATMDGITSVSKNSLNLPGGGTTEINDPNSKFEMQQSSLFSGGRVSDNLGAFIQWTWGNYGGAGHSGMDNTEVRLVGRYTPEGDLAPELVYGLLINNNMSMQDVWMNVPAWRFPWWGNGVFAGPGRIGPPGPIAAAELDGALAQRAIGFGVYGWWRKTIYAEISMYRSASGTLGFLGAGGDPNVVGDKLSGYNPYWRVAYNYDWGYNSLEVGAFGTHVKQHFSDPLTGLIDNPANVYNDYALDAQYQYNKGEPWVFATSGSFLRERASYQAAVLGTNPSDTLNEFFLRGTAYYDRKYGLSVGYASVTGSADPGLYGGFTSSSTVIASPDGSPGSNYWVLEANYVPLQNLRFTAQYFIYSKLNGASGTDQFGNKPSDANTLFAGIWWAF
jgi:hypothetical protein